MSFQTVSRFLGITTVIAATAGISAPIVGCSSAAAPPQDTGLPAEDLSTEANPYSVAYPTKGYGTQARSGNVAGNVFKNFRFYGYPNGDGTGGLQPISMAKYFDPEMRNYKIIVLSVTGNWCTYCRQETAEIIAKNEVFKGKQIAMIQAVAEGKSSGIPATKDNFDAWVKDYKHNFDVFLDDGKRNLSQYFASGGLPFNLVIDARTMEILSAQNGTRPPPLDKEYDSFVKWVDGNAPTEYK